MTDHSHIPEIDVREGLSPEELRREYIEKNRPVVLKNAAPYWRHRWTPELLRNQYGERLILAEHDELYQNQKTKKTMRISELVDSVLSESLTLRVRTSSAAFLNAVPELKKDLETDNFSRRYFDWDGDILSNFWISPRRNTSVMHHDTFYENLNCMIWGRKSFIFIAPKDTSRIYPHFMNESPVNPLQPDLAKFPRFAGVELLQGTIEAGDILFIPQFWWHFTTAEEPCINLNIWLKAPWRSTWRVLSTMPLSSQVTYTILYNGKLYKWFMRNMRSVHNLYTRLLPGKKEAAAPAH